MYKIARLSDDERQELFRTVASKMGMNESIVEKDYWVCVVLDYLFHKSKWREGLAFKGGTSLSKAYNLIERFSEDIDLILDWRILGYGIREPWEERSNTKQQKFIDESRERLFSYLKDEFVPELREGLSSDIGQPAIVQVDENDEGIVNFVYPCASNDPVLLRVIRLEIGALAAWTPTQTVDIKPYMSEIYPGIFDKNATKILTTAPERTFWEKATILHQEAFRPDTSRIPSRYSRHYYDLLCMANKGVKDSALSEPDLLDAVAMFKNKFYPRKWARYDLAKIGTLKLVPPDHSLTRLRQDYADMKSMIFGDYPSFDELMYGINQLEDDINK